MKLNQLLTAASLLFVLSVFQSPLAYSHEEKMTASDTDLVRQIRHDLASDSTLSAYAQNIKVIAHNGKVILKGTVKSEVEKQTIYDRVAGETGVSSVVSKLEVKSLEY